MIDDRKSCDRGGCHFERGHNWGAIPLCGGFANVLVGDAIGIPYGAIGSQR
jgi:hypothetical protein